jgi:hypothetical protein
MAIVQVPGALRGGQVEFYAHGVPMTATVGAAQTATGGLLVEGMAGDRVVRTAQVGSFVCVGLACWDAAAGAQVAVALDGVWMVMPSGAIPSGSKIICGAAGVAVVAGTTPDARSVVARAIADLTNVVQGPAKLSL